MIKSLALTAALALTLTACATAPVSADKAAAANAKPPAGCIAQTATRIPVKNDACAGFGSSYSQKDIDNTGQTDLSRALPMLDPAISRH